MELRMSSKQAIFLLKDSGHCPMMSLQDSVVEDREQQQGSNMLGVLSAAGYQVLLF